ncbi:Transcriptional regulator of RNA polII, SAGA, subunit [Carex littledalei]|uniref:Transcriptional regulator of RNA polII, SAGA, subunit n=1 Tax=Carex littledalei TaxID=544730 RepID=A0A833R4E0_9POAL|nr:Transcriptional regulator of RNA polII, SAGA, subunit [Carex littledalei]
MEHEPNMDKGKKIDEEINEEYDTSLKRDRFENDDIAEPCEEENILMKKARVGAPLGIPSYHASMDGPGIQTCSSRGWGSHIDKGSCSSSGELPDTESLMNQIDSIAKSQGLDGASPGVAKVLHSGLDEYIKRIIRPCINLKQSGSYQVTMRDSESCRQMNKQWVEQLGSMSSLTQVPLSKPFFPSSPTVGTGIDLNQDPISRPYCRSPSSGGTNGRGTSAQTDMDVDLNLSPDASASGFPIMSSAGVSVGTGTLTSLTQGPIPSSIPPWAQNLTYSGSAANTIFGMDMARNLTIIGSGAAACMSRDIPCNLARTGSGADTSTGKDVSENLVCAGRDACTDIRTGSIFFIGSPEEGNTESMENQMERAENVNGLQHIGVSSAGAVSGSDNLNGSGCMHRTVTLQDLQIAMLMDPQLLGENWPVKMEELLSRSFE